MQIPLDFFFSLFFSYKTNAWQIADMKKSSSNSNNSTEYENGFWSIQCIVTRCVRDWMTSCRMECALMNKNKISKIKVTLSPVYTFIFGSNKFFFLHFFTLYRTNKSEFSCDVFFSVFPFSFVIEILCFFFCEWSLWYFDLTNVCFNFLTLSLFSDVISRSE